ncbi:hypothetical protein AB0F71_12950 [Kitasatospora sp. NPDC028055]|uniref:hypothetical protein n=1 Tax=Kitasatospora sp. NPDC028055 TaxID=3155653 RepID=UPI0033ED3D43
MRSIGDRRQRGEVRALASRAWPDPQDTPQGRTVRFDRKTDLGGVQVRTRGTFRDFGPVERIDPPR